MWEDWFRESPLSVVRSELRARERDLEIEKRDTENRVGSKYPELLAVADRLESLAALTSQMETHIAAFAEQSKDLHIAHPRSLRPNLDPRIRSKLGALLVSLAERSLVLEKFDVCAHALYLCDVLGQPHDAVGLGKRLEAFVMDSDQLPQRVYHACLIHFRIAPASFAPQFLAWKQQHFDALLQTSVADAFKSVDATTFVFDQLMDLTQSRLAQRRLVDLHEFADPSIAFLLQLVCERDPSLLQARCFPNECYAAADSATTSADAFIQEVAATISSSASFKGDLVGMLASLVSQTQSALKVDAMAQLLEALLPVFAKRLTAHIETELSGSPDEETVLELRAQLGKLGKIAHSMTYLAPSLPPKLEAIVSEATRLVNARVDSTYEQNLGKLANEEKPNLADTAAQVSALHALNSTYRRLNGTPQKVPKKLYILTAEFLLQEWQDTRRYLGDPMSTAIWDLQVLMDKYGISSWEEGLEEIREVVMRAVRERVKEKERTRLYEAEAQSAQKSVTESAQESAKSAQGSVTESAKSAQESAQESVTESTAETATEKSPTESPTESAAENAAENAENATSSATESAKDVLDNAEEKVIEKTAKPAENTEIPDPEAENADATEESTHKDSKKAEEAEEAEQNASAAEKARLLAEHGTKAKIDEEIEKKYSQPFALPTRSALLLHPLYEHI